MRTMVLLLSCWAICPDASAAAEREAQLTEVSGPVTVRLGDQASGEFMPAQSGMSVASGDEIRTGEGGSAELSLDGESVIQLQPNTVFSVSSLSVEATELKLSLGALLGKLQSLLVGQSLLLRTPTAVAAVRGTELGVSQESEDDFARVAVFDEGHVTVSGAGSEGSVTLGPNQETLVARGRPIAQPRALDFFLRSRAPMARARARLAQIHRHWRPLAPAERLRARKALLRGHQGPRLKERPPQRRRRAIDRPKERQRRSFRRSRAGP